jgi:hypothetical protein
MDVTLGDVGLRSLVELRYGATPPFDGRTSTNLLRELGLSATREGSVAQALNRLDEATSDWSDDHRFKLVSAIELMADAERARTAWNPKELSAEHRRVAAEGMRSARLAIALSTAFPDPTPAIVGLVGQLLDFTDAALDESTVFDADLARYVAGRFLKKFRKEVSACAISNILLADLVVVALGRTPGRRGAQFDESTLRRRYLQGSDDEKFSSRRRSPAHKQWRRGWNELKQLATLSSRVAPARSETQTAAFSAAIRARLQQPPSAPTSRRRSPGLDRVDSQPGLDDARTFRAELTRQFQAAKAQGLTILRAEINAVLVELPVSEEYRKGLLAKVRAHTKPSDVAARISAEKYGLPLRDVRQGPQAVPRRPGIRRIEYVANLVATEELAERRRRGRRVT